MKGTFRRALITSVLTFLAIGWIFNFQYFDTADFNIHDTYIVASPFELASVLAIYFLFFLLLIDGVRNRLQSRALVWSLAVVNLFIVLSLVFAAYAMNMLFSGFSRDVSFVIIVLWLIPILGLTAFEFILIRKLL